MLTLAQMTREAGSPATPSRLTEIHEPLRERLGLEAEVRRLNRERSLARFENQLLSEIVQRDGASAAAEALLRRLVPQPSLSFAALIDVSQTHSQLIASRGLPDSISESLAIPNQMLEQLRVEPWLFFASEETNRSGILASLVVPVRRTVDDVWLIGIRDGSNLVAVLVTSSLWPAAVPRDEQLDLLSRVGQTLARLIVRDRELKHRDDELRASRDMLTLRTIADRATSPRETSATTTAKPRWA